MDAKHSGADVIALMHILLSSTELTYYWMLWYTFIISTIMWLYLNIIISFRFLCKCFYSFVVHIMCCFMAQLKYFWTC